MWWFLRLSCGGLKFLPSQIAISSKCGAERTLSGWLVSLAAWQFLITALIPNDTVVRLLRCFCLKVVHSCVVKSDAYLFGQNPVCRGKFFSVDASTEWAFQNTGNKLPTAAHHCRPEACGLWHLQMLRSSERASPSESTLATGQARD